MKSLGIIGGLGPMATAYLLQLIIEMTDAKTDQEHLDVIVFNRPQVPDRTAYILDSSLPSPLVSMSETAKTLEALGVSYLCAPCVTSHYFYEELAAGVSIPLIHMVKETAAQLHNEGKRKTGILATTGTVTTGLFQNALQKAGLEAVTPDGRGQALVMEIIYGEIKAGKPVDLDKFRLVSESLFSQGCDSIILGCTELSLIKKDFPLGAGYIDALEVLAKRCVELCGAPLKPRYSSLIS